MKLIIYIILFIILIIYVNNQSIEQFTNNPKRTVAYLSQSDKQKYVSITDNKLLISPPSVSINNTKYPQMSMYNPYISINQYNANYNPYFKSHLNNSYFDNVVSYNDTNVEPKGNNTVKGYESWILKDSGYSDIFNYEDVGGDQLNHILNTPKPVIFLDKTMTNINNKIHTNKSVWHNPIGSPMLPDSSVYQIKHNIQDQSTIQNKQDTDLNNNQDNTLIDQSNSTGELETTETQKKALSYSDTIIDNNIKYHLLGVAYNHVYNQYYLIYESIKRQNDDNLILKDNMSNMKLQLYDYALVQIENNKEVIKYIFGPRDKINYNDIVHFHKGFIKLGPFIINNI